jgi:predicted metal-dependent hydrolase
MKRSGNKVLFGGGKLVLQQGSNARTSLSRTLENWLRKQARQEINQLLTPIAARLKVAPRGIYVMGQRTKWGNCSAKKNLSFNWRLVLAPEFVLRYFISHEVVHLAVPDHSPRFWLTVQSICPEAQKAKQWLRTNTHRLFEDLEKLCEPK